ncbi:TonB-dependent receptor plug domain-containing protein [Comamonas flocculans]|uniref:TonB-dependent receptor n=1 Tax=Comamonas flocculans TaxID=2597701 RepID=A0A5B8RX76_9BURK|nr:TonB-dependent receptor [Comamonas flocculans]QEA12835.1 TonB-dependent receptor [Comamonas flocculans]
MYPTELPASPVRPLDRHPAARLAVTLACAGACALAGAQQPPAPGAAPTLAPVVVTGTRSEKPLDETPIRTEVVDGAEIQRTHARTLKQALEDVPGLQLSEVHGKSGYEVSLQGLTSDQVLVLIDGLPITASTGSTVDLSQYLLTEVDHVEVVKGAASAQYGSSAMGGVINVITRPIAPGFSGEAVLDLGSHDGQNPSGRSLDPASRHARVRLDGGNVNWRYRLSGDVLHDAGFAIDPSAWARQGDAVRRGQLGARLEWLPAASTRLWLDASRYQENDSQRFNYFAPPNDVPQSKDEAITRNRLGWGGRWRGDGGLSAEVKGVSERYASDSDTYSNAFLQQSRQAAQRTDHVTAQVDLPAWRNQLWQFGLDLHRESLAQSADGSTELSGGRVRRASNELFAQNDILWSDTWELLLGLRGQHDSDFGAHFAPKASLRAKLWDGPDWKGALRASFGRGYRVPNLKERYFLFDHSALGYMVIGNPNLKPESSTSLQLGAQLSLRERLNLDVNLFDNRVSDLIQVDEANATSVNGITHFTYQNIARARTRGLEALATWRAHAGLRLRAGYTFTQTRNLDTGTELTRRPRQSLRLGLDWQPSPADTLSLRARYQSSELVDTASGGRSPAWTTLDLMFNHQLDRATTAFVGVNNLFNRQRNFGDPTDFGPLAGRFVYAGIRHEFGKTP